MQPLAISLMPTVYDRLRCETDNVAPDADMAVSELRLDPHKRMT